MSSTRAYEELVDFLAEGIDPRKILAFEPSKEAKARFADLVERDKEGSLSRDEKSELNHSLEIEHLMRLVKARARRSPADV